MNQVTYLISSEKLKWKGKEGSLYLPESFSYLRLFETKDKNPVIGNFVYIRSHKTQVIKFFECIETGYDKNNKFRYRKFRNDDLIYVTIWDDSSNYELNQ